MYKNDMATRHYSEGFKLNILSENIQNESFPGFMVYNPVRLMNELKSMTGKI